MAAKRANFGQSLIRPSRRQVIKWGVMGAVAGMVPFGASLRVQAQAAGQVKLIHPSPAALVLWSVTFLAEDMGYYKEEGLEFERILLNGGPAALTALLAGEGDANVSAPGECLAANARGQKVNILESYTNSDAYSLVITKALAEKLGVTAASSLADRQAALATAKGKFFGVTAPGSQTDLTTRMALTQVGLDPAKDVVIAPLGNIVNVIAALTENRIEGGVLLAPFTEQAIADLGVVPLLRTAAGEVPAASRMQGQVLEARGEDVAAHPDTYAAMVRADLRALRMIIESPDEARDQLRETRFSKVAEAIWPAVWSGQLPTFKTPYVTADGLQAWIETGAIGGNPDPKTFPYAEVIDMQFVDAGLKAMDWTPPA